MKALLTTLALLVASPAIAGEHPDRLMFLVSLIDRAPTRAMLLDAGAGARGEGLAAIAADRDLPRYPRARAAALLAWFPLATQELSALVSGADDAEVRIQAIDALVRVQGPAALPTLIPVLDGRRADLRGAAARALARVAAPEVQDALQSRRAMFTPAVRWVVDRLRP